MTIEPAAIARLGEYAALLLAAGSLSFWAAVAPRSLRGADPRLFGAALARTRAIARWAAAAALLAALLRLLAEAQAIGGSGWPDAELIARLLTATGFGMAWLARGALVLMLFLVLALPPSRASEPLAAGIALAAVASLALAGHAAAASGATAAGDVLHLLLAAIWLGGLVPLAGLLRSLARDPVAAAKVGTPVCRRFSTLGILCVGGLVLTGVLNAWSLVGSIPGLVGTAYGRLLLLKIALFLAMIALAAVNRQRLAPALAEPGAARRLARNAALEAGLGLLVLADVAVLGISIPAAHDEPLWPFAVSWSWAAARAALWREVLAMLALALATAGLVALGRGLLGSDRRLRWAGAAAVVLALVAGGFACSLAAVPTVYVASPLPYSVATLAVGQQVYFDACASCHGAHGYGDGPAAASLPKPPADLARQHAAHHSDGTLWWWVTHGRGEGAMPAFGGVLDDQQRWAAVGFLRLQSDAEAARALGPALDPALRFPAPDFAMERGGGAQETLASLRGRKAVLLVLYTLPGSAERLDRLAGVASALEAEGLEVAAFPLAETARTGAIYAPADPDLAAIYSLFARPASDAEPSPRHLEFLIDRWGYLRARWIGESAAPSQLAALLRTLNAEPEPPPPESGHHH